MSPLIIYTSREIKSKGLQKTVINQEKLQEYFFPDEFAILDLLTTIPVFSTQTENPTLLYPGCGTDIFTPLIYLEKLFPQISTITLELIDTTNYLATIKTMLDDVNISFEENNNTLKFYWNNLLITLNFKVQNIFTITLPNFNIYFEKAFRIMKEPHKNYEEFIYDNLPCGGILISDSGFQHTKIKKIKVPPELSAYQEMIMGIKE